MKALRNKISRDFGYMVLVLAVLAMSFFGVGCGNAGAGAGGGSVNNNQSDIDFADALLRGELNGCYRGAGIACDGNDTCLQQALLLCRGETPVVTPDVDVSSGGETKTNNGKAKGHDK